MFELPNLIASAAFVIASGALYLRWVCAAHPEYAPDGTDLAQQMAAAPWIIIPGIGAGLSAYWLAHFFI